MKLGDIRMQHQVEEEQRICREDRSRDLRKSTYELEIGERTLTEGSATSP